MAMQLRILLGSQSTPWAVSWIRADRCQRSGLTVSVSVMRQRNVATPVPGIICRSSNAAEGNCGKGCGCGTCSLSSWAKP